MLLFKDILLHPISLLIHLSCTSNSPALSDIVVSGALLTLAHSLAYTVTTDADLTSHLGSAFFFSIFFFTKNFLNYLWSLCISLVY